MRIKIAAVIATHNRPGLLANRALASVELQTRPPDYLVVVDDSDVKTRSVNEGIVAGFMAEEVKAFYLENHRTPGLSGACNSALSWLQSVYPDSYVAFLDDDDRWEPTYLQRCEETVARDSLDMAAAGIVYHSSPDDAGGSLTIPRRLDANELLVRNPHIQGSNLFVRLRKLLEAGGFDEGLVSTTDRDICIRLADLSSVRFGPLNEHLVHHYAEGDRSRLSTPGSEAKCMGLTHFFRKYSGRMSDEQRDAFLKRSRDLFGCDADAAITMPPVPEPDAGKPYAGERLDLIVGAITSPDVTAVSRLIDDLAIKIASRNDVALKIVLLENGGADDPSRRVLANAVDDALGQGLDVTVKTLEDQASDVEAGVLSATPEQLSGRKSIAVSRTMLQHYLYLEAKPRPGAVVWILDDDVRLESLAYRQDGSTHSEDVDYVRAIMQLRETGSSVVLGQVTGDPPLPVLSCVRTQLVDLYHNLQQLASLGPEALYPDRRDENRLLRLDCGDYYYDLSRSGTDHLESPFWYEAGENGLLAGDVFEELTSRLSDILGGRQVFRPLVQAGHVGDAADLAPSARRGPNTLVFDVEALRDFPNAVPTIDGADTRRSDMVWSLLNRHVGGRGLVQAPLPVRQDRRANPGPKPDFGTLAQDIRGYALYSALHDVLLQKAQRRQAQGREPYGRNLLDFDDDEIDHAAASYSDHLAERLRAFELSSIRVMGLVRALRPFYDRRSAGARPAWWLDSTRYGHSVDGLRLFVDALSPIYSEARIEEFIRRLSDIDTGPVKDYFKNLGETVHRHRSSVRLPVDALRSAAEDFVRREFGTGALTCLGVGGEGVVLTDGRLAYKHFHSWKPRNRERQVEFLQSLVGRFAGCRTLLDILEVRQRGSHVVTVHPYETGTKYSGGRLEELLTLLRECREAGIACRNIHPDNLLVTSSGIKLIDYGSDIVPASDREFQQMCRRAFLTYLFHFRSDLKGLMARALTDPDLPELAGFPQFLNALDPRGWDELFHRPMADLVLRERPESVLDYGCGDGRLAEQMSGRGIRTFGYDPDPAAVSRCTNRGTAAEYGGRELLEDLRSKSARFQVVVCSRVLCNIADSMEFEAVLKDLRQLVDDTGTVFVTVCNPFYLRVTSTELVQKHVPCGHEYGGTFSYTKTVIATGNRRTEVHRSFATYKRAFEDAGLHVEEVIELDGTDSGYLRPASEHLVFRLSSSTAIASADSGPRVSLLIKTCLMEWRAIERLVRHQMGQLAGPTRFVEGVIVVDPSMGPFARQYDHPDPVAHRAAMERLVADGIVNRVVYAPEEPETVRATYMKWFGVESDETHSVDGQQIFATLYGFDSCTGDYVLQLDSDLLIARAHERHDYLGEMVEVLCKDPNALFVPLSICRSLPQPYTSEGPRGDWRVEVRGCLFDRQRLQSVLPVPNELEDGRFALAWHRAFDRFIASGEHRSYRGGDPATAFIHVPNDRKADADEMSEIIGAVERGYVPRVQLGNVELTGSVVDWAGPKRGEPFVFVTCGRNVDPGRFKRCFESLEAQDCPDWGAVVVDDASSNGFGDYAEVLLGDHADRVTIIRNTTRRGALFNTWNVITKLCDNPDTVILTLDADDALLGEHVLARVRAEYEAGADVTVGSMLRLDKEALYSGDFQKPRSWRSNVWQHLRTFRKYLFDAIDVEDLKLDGEWIDLANDWAFMVPIVEMASSPRRIPEPVYLYEPSDQKRAVDRAERDSIIARILAKPAYGKLERDL